MKEPLHTLAIAYDSTIGGFVRIEFYDLGIVRLHTVSSYFDRATHVDFYIHEGQLNISLLPVPSETGVFEARISPDAARKLLMTLEAEKLRKTHERPLPLGHTIRTDILVDRFVHFPGGPPIERHISL